MRKLTIACLAAAFAATPALPAFAYIGPGAGAGAIAVVLGILASIVMAFFAILWYPIKRLLKTFRRKNHPSAQILSADSAAKTIAPAPSATSATGDAGAVAEGAGAGGAEGERAGVAHGGAGGEGAGGPHRGAPDS